MWRRGGANTHLEVVGGMRSAALLQEERMQVRIQAAAPRARLLGRLCALPRGLQLLDRRRRGHRVVVADEERDGPALVDGHEGRHAPRRRLVQVKRLDVVKHAGVLDAQPDIQCPLVVALHATAGVACLCVFLAAWWGMERSVLTIRSHALFEAMLRNPCGRSLSVQRLRRRLHEMMFAVAAAMAAAALRSLRACTRAFDPMHWRVANA